MALNTSTSIVDWLKAHGTDSSFQNRAKLANQFGIASTGTYKGTANQNVNFLNYVKSNGLNAPKQAAPVSVPTAKTPGAPAPPKPILSTDQLRDYSLRALAGDKSAIDHLKNAGIARMSSVDLWKGLDPKDGTYFDELGAKYSNIAKNARNIFEFDFMDTYKDTDYAIQYDEKHRPIYEDMIRNDKSMTDWQVNWYNDMAQRRNLENMNDPFVRQRWQLEQDKKNAMKAQDVAMNQGLANMDAQSFQQAQGLQQQMSDRGIQDSGIASAMYNQAQMANNQQYQQAFTEGTAAKADLQTQFNNAISGSRMEQAGFEAEQQQAIMENNTKLMEIQNDQDKWLTQETGNVFLGGQRLMVNGKPITTVDWEKMSEEKRHNAISEMLTQQKNAWDYQLGTDRNANDRLGIEYDYALGKEKHAIDLQIAMSKLSFDYASLNFDYAKLESNNAIAQQKIAISAANAQTAADKNKLTALSAELNNVTKQMEPYLKQGKPVPDHLDKAYRNVIGKLQSFTPTQTSGGGGRSFNQTSGGGGWTPNTTTYKVTSNFGTRKDPITGKSSTHRGIDLGVPANTSLGSPVSGKVVSVTGHSSYGNTVVIQDANGNLHRYAHMNVIGVKVGATVSRGQYVGKSGNTGRSTGAHLHYEVTNSKGSLLNPKNFM